MSCDISIIVLTLNEENNLPHALASVCGWARNVFVFDSLSTDRTVEIAQEFGCVVVQHPFENYGSQRNAALERLPIDTEWVFFLDADEWMPDAFKREVEEVVSSKPRQDGFYCKFRMLWMGRWIRHGYYPTWVLRLFRHQKGRCEERRVNEHLLIQGDVGFLKTDFIHEDRNGIDRWVHKHLRYATQEAAASFARTAEAGGLTRALFGTQAQRKRWVRYNVWERLPPLVRPVLYFGYRYVLRGGFLDGRESLGFHVLQGLWFQTVIDMKYLEMKKREMRDRPAADGTRGEHTSQT